MEHLEIIRDFILRNFLFGDKNRMPGDEESLLELGMIDSTGVLEMVAFLEKKFHITVTDEELIPDNLDSIQHIAKYLEKKWVEVRTDIPEVT